MFLFFANFSSSSSSSSRNNNNNKSIITSEIEIGECLLPVLIQFPVSHHKKEVGNIPDTQYPPYISINNQIIGSIESLKKMVSSRRKIFKCWYTIVKLINRHSAQSTWASLRSSSCFISSVSSAQAVPNKPAKYFWKKKENNNKIGEEWRNGRRSGRNRRSGEGGEEGNKTSSDKLLETIDGRNSNLFRPIQTIPIQVCHHFAPKTLDSINTFSIWEHDWIPHHRLGIGRPLLWCQLTTTPV